MIEYIQRGKSSLRLSWIVLKLGTQPQLTYIFETLHDELSMTGSSLVKILENWDTEHAFSPDSHIFTAVRRHHHNDKKNVILGNLLNTQNPPCFQADNYQAGVVHI